MEDKLCKSCADKFNKIIGEDMGFDSAYEYYGMIKDIELLNWADELIKDKIDSSKFYYLVALYCNHNFEDYYKYSIEWLLKTDDNCINVEIFEKFLVSKSGKDFRENEPITFIDVLESISSKP